MSSISSTATSQLNAIQRSPPSPKSRIASAISSEAASGAITSTDATALTSALDSIDSSLKGGATSDGSTSGSSNKTRLDPSSIKERIDGLIADQVSKGTLTGDQASTLKSLFAQGADKGQDAGAVGETGGRRGHGGHHGPPPSDDATSGASSTGSATSSTSDTASTSDLLASFIKQLQTAQASSTGYAASANGASAVSSNTSALLFDFQS